MLRLSSLVFLFALGACATTKGVPVLQRSAQPELAPFAFNGRVAVKHDGERTSAGLRWTHRGAEDEILLLAPLGQTVARIFSNTQGVILETSGKVYVEKDAETLTERQLGWRLPLSGLTGWVRARPAAGAVVRRDALGRPVSLTESGWQIEFSYDGDSGLPRRLILIYTLAERALEIRLVIDEWT